LDCIIYKQSEKESERGEEEEWKVYDGDDENGRIIELVDDDFSFLSTLIAPQPFLSFAFLSSLPHQYVVQATP